MKKGKAFGRYLELAYGDGLVRPRDADEGIDRLLRWPCHGGRIRCQRGAEEGARDREKIGEELREEERETATN